MSETSQDYTSGPWSIVGAIKVWKTGSDGAAVAIMAEPEIQSSADFRPVEIHSRRFDEACANARLIAAAPDLLEAAKGAQCSCSIAERESGHLTDCWMPALEAAIAKAEGKS